jgi:AraC family transcriptional regulator, regulatory protein of adaptative response / methylated-DNA-[protein]-cysteine methyltransferase
VDAQRILKSVSLNTKLGPMLCITDDQYLYLLEFVDQRGVDREIERLKDRLKASIIPGETKITGAIEEELTAYFDGISHSFTTPIFLLGTPFQKQVWEILRQIPPGETRAYSDVAKIMGKSSAFRAVAQANGANQLAIIIPCHRVINANGNLGGYAGGIARKQWLLQHERMS